MEEPKPGLDIKLLGELRVLRDGVRQTLPPSKKTRALLGYLLLTGRTHRREHLCGLLWDVADDPRGALRWSLSKLRALLDQPAAARVAADRDGVAIELHGAQVDVLAMRRALGTHADLDGIATEVLEHWAVSSCGDLLEGLDLPDFDEFQAFCVGQREQTRKLRARVLSSLCARMTAAPEQALPYARAWVQVDALSLPARSALMQLSYECGHLDEANQYYAAAKRAFEELGSRQGQALDAAWAQIRRTPSLMASKTSLTPRGRETRTTRLSYTALARPGAHAEVVGRTHELERLCQALSSVVAERRVKVVLVNGEPGIGKSHLLEAFARESKKTRTCVMIGRTYEGERGRPYGPLIDSVRSLGHRDAAGRGEDFLAAFAPPSPEAARDVDASKARLFAQALRFIEKRAAEAAALLLIVEDVHWIDQASTELLHYVARSAQRVPMLVVLSARSEEIADNAALVRLRRSLRRDRLLEEYALAPLQPSAIEQLLDALGSPMDARRVAEQAGGNPLFALELARVGEVTDERLPESVGAAVRERLERLTPIAADVLRWGAVLEHSFGLSDLQAVASFDQDALLNALEWLEQGALLRNDAHENEEPNDGVCRYRFAHAIVRRVVYADLSESRRQAMHGRIARVLRERADHSEDQLAQLVHHASLAHDHSVAAEACVEAGIRCRRVFANDQAIQLARRGLRHADLLGGLERIRRSIELLEIELWCSARHRTGALIERIRGFAEEALTNGAVSHARRAFNVLSYSHFDDGSYGDAHRHMLMAELVSRSADPVEQVLSMAEAGRCLMLLGRDRERAARWIEEADTQAKLLRIEPAVLRDGQGMLLWACGSLREAAQCFEQASALAAAERNRLVEFHALEHRACLEFDRNDFEAAARLCESLVDVASSLPEGTELPFAHTLAALSRFALGRGSDHDVDSRLADLRSLDAKRQLVQASISSGQLALAAGRPELALRWAGDAPVLAEDLERTADAYLLHAIIAQAQARLGQRAAARAIRDDLEERGSVGIPPATLARARELMAGSN